MKPTWERGNVRLYLGDCRSVLPHVGKVDACVTDPPYGVAFSCGWANKFCGVSIANDESTSVRDDVLDWLGDRPSLVFGSWKAERPKSTKMLLVWDKGTVGMGDLSLPWFPSTEEIYVLGSGWNGTRTRSVMPHYVRNENHPTEKPVSLILELLEKFQHDWSVIDPFMGSGTTGVAAVQTGRAFVGVEIDPVYFEIAVRRIDKAIDAGALFAPVPPAVREVGLFGEVTP